MDPGGTPRSVRFEPKQEREASPSALEIAVDQQNHAWSFFILCNGYDPNGDRDSPLDLALRARRWDLLELLLEWGADPQRVNLEELFGTYRSDLFERSHKADAGDCQARANEGSDLLTDN